LTFEQLVDVSAGVLTLIALIGAIWSAFMFVKKIYEEREGARQNQVSRWRIATVQEIMMTSPDFLSTDQIKTKLRDSSFEQSFGVKKNELNERDVRLLLIEMVSTNIIMQVYGDLYGLQQHRFDPSARLAADNVVANDIFRESFDLIRRFPGHYTDEKLFDEIGESSGFRKSDFVLAISDLKIRGFAEKNENGAWVPTSLEPKAE